jgi:hypothetical protein
VIKVKKGLFLRSKNRIHSLAHERIQKRHKVRVILYELNIDDSHKKPCLIKFLIRNPYIKNPTKPENKKSGHQ